MGRKLIDLTGQKFGKLTVISLNEEVSKQKEKPYWNCKCECGNEKVVYGSSLRGGGTTSCGCYKKEQIKDLTGMKFGKLTVISYNEEVSKQKKGTHWNCKCDCGNERIVWCGDLKNGKTISCGCYKKDKMREMVNEKWQDEEFRQMQSELSSKILKELWKDEEYRQTRSELSSKILKELWKDEEYRQMKSDKAREQMKGRVGENSPNYKGGISPISEYLRGLPIVKQWRRETYTRENNKCQLTGKHVHGGNSDVHHLYGFNMIVLEAHELHNIQVKPQVKDYTEEELHKLEEYVASWHKDGSNAVLLSEDVHSLFHSLYKYGNNTPEQIEEFRERYMAGEFEGLI